MACLNIFFRLEVFRYYSLTVHPVHVLQHLLFNLFPKKGSTVYNTVHRCTMLHASFSKEPYSEILEFDHQKNKTAVSGIYCEGIKTSVASADHRIEDCNKQSIRKKTHS